MIAAVGLLCVAPAMARTKHRAKHRTEHRTEKRPEKRVEERADDGTCLTTFKTAKDREQEGKLHEAKELFRTCSLPTCGGFVQQQCTIAFNKLESDAPTVVLLATDASGAARNDVQVRIDGTLVTSSLDGRAQPVDPGLHDFSFSADGHVFSTQKILVVQGQRNRFVVARLAGGGGAAPPAVAAEPTPSPAESPASPSGEAAKTARKKPVAAAEAAEPDGDTGAAAGATTGAATDSEPEPAVAARRAGPRHRLLPVLIGGAGLLSIGAGALLTTWGRKDNDRLGDCAPNCSPATLSHVRRLYLEADVAFGVGVAALTAAYWVYAVTHSGAAETPATEAAADTALHFGIVPTSAGAFASISSGF